MSRMLDAIGRIEAKVDTLDQEKIDKLHKDLATDLMDLIEYQKTQSWAFASGKITTFDALWLYQTFGGESPSAEKWDKLPLAHKVVATQAVKELLDMRIKV